MALTQLLNMDTEMTNSDFFLENYNSLKKEAYRITNNQALSEDIVHDVWVAVNKLETPVNSYSYLRKALVNSFLHFKYKKDNTTNNDYDLDTLPSDNNDEVYFTNLYSKWYDDIIKSDLLTDKQKQALEYFRTDNSLNSSNDPRYETLKTHRRLAIQKIQAAYPELLQSNAEEIKPIIKNKTNPETKKLWYAKNKERILIKQAEYDRLKKKNKLT